MYISVDVVRQIHLTHQLSNWIERSPTSQIAIHLQRAKPEERAALPERSVV